VSRRDRARRAAAAARDAWRNGTAPTEPEVPYEQLRDHQDNVNMRRLVAFLLREDDNCLDVGANVGGLLTEICRAAPRGRHVAFEPIPGLAEQLAERFPDVEVRQAAASNRFGTAAFAHVHGPAEGWSGLKFRPHPAIDDRDVEEITVRLEPIDEVVDPELAPRLMKIDVEGAEQQVIEGALRTITTHRPVIVFEHGAGSADVFGTGPDDVWRLLVEEAGLRIFDLDGDGPYTRDDLRRNFHEATRVNFVAHA
jgi:FkbM family methyltransferase